MRLIRVQQQWQCGWTGTPVLQALEPARYALCDEADFEYLNQFDWYLIRGDHSGDGREGFGSPRAVLVVNGFRRIETMQRLVYEHRGLELPRRVYHVNRNKLDNRFGNLTGRRSEVVDQKGSGE